MNVSSKAHIINLTAAHMITVGEGPLYERMEEDGIGYYYDLYLVLTLPDTGQQYTSNEIFKGSLNVRARVAEAIEKIQARGYVNLHHWTEVEPQPSLYERWEPFGAEWEREQEDARWE